MALPKGLTPQQYARYLGITPSELGRRGGQMAQAARRVAKALEASKPNLTPKPKPLNRQMVMDFVTKWIAKSRP